MQHSGIWFSDQKLSNLFVSTLATK